MLTVDSELDPYQISVSWSSVSLILKCTYETPLSPVALLTRSPSPILIIIFSRTSMPSSISVSGTEAPNKVETVRKIQKSCNQIIVCLLRWLDSYWRRKPGVGLNFRTFIKNWGKQRVRVHRSLYLAHLCHKVMPLYRINIYVRHKLRYSLHNFFKEFKWLLKISCW